jgi:hypothetical protein
MPVDSLSILAAIKMLDVCRLRLLHPAQERGPLSKILLARLRLEDTAAPWIPPWRGDGVFMVDQGENLLLSSWLQLK